MVCHCECLYRDYMGLIQIFVRTDLGHLDVEKLGRITFFDINDRCLSDNARQDIREFLQHIYSPSLKHLRLQMDGHIEVLEFIPSIECTSHSYQLVAECHCQSGVCAVVSKLVTVGLIFLNLSIQKESLQNVKPEYYYPTKYREFYICSNAARISLNFSYTGL